ncbi:hypothetical protein ABW20_dc0100893 [Dactylellina cionopaga]|nr:hypothetical protein ABW20_dc0100893 [Dactylellina cionopaga]
MKVNTQVFASILLLSASVSAGPLRQWRRNAQATPVAMVLVGDIPPANTNTPEIKASHHEGNAPHVAHPWMAKVKRQENDNKNGTETGNTEPKKSRKERAIERAQRHGADDKQIAFLNTVPDDVFDKMSTMKRKLGQAMSQLWDGKTPVLAELPTPQADGPRKEFNHPTNSTTGRPTPKDWAIRWAEHQGIPAESIQLLKDTPDEEFAKLKDMPLKEKLIREAELMKMTDKVTFFNTVPQNVYDDMDTLKNQVKDARKALHDGKMPTLPN